jgi:hypothetical protein
MPRQIGLSPKVLAQLLAAAVTWALGYFAIDLTPELSAAIAAVVGAIAGYQAPAGAVAHEWPTTSSDELLARQIADDPAAPPG